LIFRGASGVLPLGQQRLLVIAWVSNPARYKEPGLPLYRAAPAAVQSRAATAALGFYRELSELPPNFLVESLPCPLFAFWGEDDEEIAFGGGAQLLASGLDRRRTTSMRRCLASWLGSMS
jgi:hypothetical protein